MSQHSGDGHDLLHGGYRQRRQQESLSARDKMQASLLDRLTDNAPDKQQEAAYHTLISHSSLRRNVLRDLQWLLTPSTTKPSRTCNPFRRLNAPR